MKRILTALAAAIIATAAFAGCTDNAAAKNYGGTQNIHLKSGRKFINATWKDQNLWYVTRAMREDETPEVFSFKEKSNFGVMEGEIIFHESK